MAIVPRRAGKTLLQLAELLQVTRRQPLSRGFYLSHRRETASAMWRDDWFPLIEQSRLDRQLALRRGNGSETITWKAGGSTIRLLPPSGSAGRSASSHVIVADEAREFDLVEGAELEAGLWPTQATTDGQKWIMSNAGTTASEWLAKYRDLGRAAAPGRRTICYLEFAAPDDADPDDEATWWAAHPGLGHHVSIEALRTDHFLMDRDSFACEYLGLWPSARRDSDLSAAWWSTVDADAAPAGSVALAVETSIDRDRTVIVAAGADQTGRIVTEIVDDRPHGDWVNARLTQLCGDHDVAAVTWDRGGPVAGLVPDFTFPSAEAPLNTSEVAAAAGGFLDLLKAGRAAHRDHPTWTAAIAAANRRTAGGAWLYDRRHPAVIPLIAATLAAWTFRHHSTPQIR